MIEGGRGTETLDIRALQSFILPDCTPSWWQEHKSQGELATDVARPNVTHTPFSFKWSQGSNPEARGIGQGNRCSLFGNIVKLDSMKRLPLSGIVLLGSVLDPQLSEAFSESEALRSSLMTEDRASGLMPCSHSLTQIDRDSMSRPVFNSLEISSSTSIVSRTAFMLLALALLAMISSCGTSEINSTATSTVQADLQKYFYYHNPVIWIN